MHYRHWHFARIYPIFCQQLVKVLTIFFNSVIYRRFQLPWCYNVGDIWMTGHGVRGGENGRENQSIRRKVCPKSILSTISPKWTYLGLNVDFRDEVPVINRLGQCTAHDFPEYVALKFVCCEILNTFAEHSHVTTRRLMTELSLIWRCGWKANFTL